MCDSGRRPKSYIIVIVVLNAINQVCKSTLGAAGSRSACGRDIGSFVPGHADVAGDPEDGPVNGAGPEEGQDRGPSPGAR